MAFYPNSSTVLSKPFVFDDTYIPDRSIGREREKEVIRSLLEPARRNLKPVNCWLHGPSGSGKTCLVRSTLTETQSEFGLRWVYVNCWQTPTYYLVLDSLVEQLRLLGAEAQVTKVKADAIVRAIGNRPLVVVLDELDVVAPRQRSAILYNLSHLAGLALVCITYTSKALGELDARVRSRLSCQIVEMQRYATAQIVEVLKQRAELGLFPGACSDEVLSRIAELAEGNSRTAIQILRNAALLAERKRSQRVLADHVNDCRPGTGDLRKQHMMDALTPHLRLLLTLVQEQGSVASGDLWRLYLEECDRRGIAPIAVRTYRNYLRQLVTMRLLVEEPVIDRGRKRVLRIKGAVDRGEV